MTEDITQVVEIHLREDDTVTRVEAELQVGSRQFNGHGWARRNRLDPEVSAIGEELAIARALADLSHELMHAASEDIAVREGQHAELRS